MSTRPYWGCAYIIDGTETRLLEGWVYEMDQTMKRDAGHDVNKKRRNLVKTVEHHRISPHSYSYRVVSHGKTVSADE